MIRIDLDTLANALKTARRKRATVKQQGDEDIYLVKCQNPDHPDPHAVFFDERNNGLFGACDCPSRRACYHLVHAANLRAHVQEIKLLSSRTTLYPSEVLAQGAGVKPAEKIRGIRL